MSPASSTWSTQDQIVLFENLVRLFISHRGEIYDDPRLAQHNGNSGHKINQHLQQMLRKIETGIPGAAGITAAVVGFKAAVKGSASEKGKSPKKRAAGDGGVKRESGSPKKRRIKLEDIDSAGTSE